MPPDVVVVGAGPAGATAAIVLARAGVQVTLLDRARFPRDKLCGDTLNPGTIAILRRLGIEDEVTSGAVRLEGMRLTGPGGARVEGRYPAGVTAAALPRRDLDVRVVRAAVSAGATFEEGVTVEAALLRGTTRGTIVAGVRIRAAGGASEISAPVTIAADGRSSVLASSLGLSRRPAFPGRWAIGSYYENVGMLVPLGEMHVRGGHYLGVAPLPGGLANAILVLPLTAMRGQHEPVPRLLAHALARDAELAPRFAHARPVAPPAILGPMAVDVRPPACDGLLVAGDAAGFIDPMTGDGMRFAIAGGELAALAALAALEHGWDGVQHRLALRRRQLFGKKRLFNRALRRLTASASAVRTIDASAPVLSLLLSRVISYAGDVGR